MELKDDNDGFTMGFVCGLVAASVAVFIFLVVVLWR
jgi:hypothetical protein